MGGLRNDHEVLITKAFLDGFMAMVLTTTLGFGVVFSVIPVILYQGSIALLAVQINKWLPQQVLDGFINEVTAIGGLLILAIGLNILNITKIKIGDFLPAIFVFIIFYFSYSLLV
ncbi:membrane protein [Gracilibacillus boraciitolerans JCM 21714]|uniref:Membrane protein n=1 Tax=Gracilibacillus boraciitolerans JCM 21714 TaxID=1298598 RepID=W4VKD5_9BACI|nr:membrane protein [Gracilibacillus boraciitolerans JCM 21714]